MLKIPALAAAVVSAIEGMEIIMIVRSAGVRAILIAAACRIKKGVLSLHIPTVTPIVIHGEEDALNLGLLAPRTEHQRVICPLRFRRSLLRWMLRL